MNARKRIAHVVIYVVLAVMALATLFPLWFLLINSFKSQSEIIKSPLALPKSLDFSHILNAIKQIDLGNSFLLTALITVVGVAFIIVVSSSVAWMMVRFKSKVANALLLVFTASMLVPFQAIMYPLINEFDDLGLKNTSGLVIMYGGFGLAISVFLYHGFIKSIPVSLEEAAFMDGANVFQVYWKIVMPLMKPTTATVAILNGMWIWNDYLLPFLVIGNGEHKTLTLAVYFAKIESGQYGNAWDLIFPAVLITIIPIVVIFLFLQKHIIKGMIAGSVKQ